MDDLENAREFAIAAHGDQRYGDGPYQVHLAAVAAVLDRFGIATDPLRQAAWLHDTVEDTDTTREQIAERFGDHVAALVWAVTNEAGPNRRARNAATYPKIARQPGAVLLKLADRIANVESCIASGDRRLSMYAREYPGFRAALRSDGDEVARPLWDHLDALIGTGR